jgi:Flp pilus assembly protein TadG
MIRAFRRDARGSIALVFALALVPVIGAAAAALDYSNASRVRTKLQTDLDAAVLAAAAAPTGADGDRVQRGIKLFQAASPARAARLDLRVTDGKVAGRAQTEVPTFLAGIIGSKATAVVAEAEAAIPDQGLEAEIALVLDYSGSMLRNGKYLAMRDAATAFIENVITRDPLRKSKVALVPFSEYVLASMPTDYLEDVDPSWWGRTVDVCLDGRQYPAAVNGTPPRAADEATKWEAIGLPPEYFLPAASAKQKARKEAKAGAAASGTALDEKNQSDVTSIDALCQEYGARGLKLQPLTNDLRSLATALRAMRPVRMTNIALGLELGWHALTPEVPFPGAKPYGGRNVKMVVLLSDGEQTSPGHGPGQSFNIAQADRNTAELCGHMKSKGIRIATVAFQLESLKAKRLLQECASSADLYFDAQSNSDLSPIFDQIGAQLNNVARLTR